jgi:hypothetical protein
MKKEQFIEQLTQPDNYLSEKKVDELAKISGQYPYFHAAKAMYLKGLKQHHNFKYNKVLKETAALTTERAVLFDFITNFTSFENLAASQRKPKIPQQQPLEIGQPLEFTSQERHSFSEWLQLGNVQPIKRNEKTSENLLQKNKDLIDLFIENNPSISPVDKDKEKNPIEKVKLDSQGLMTETLAKVYLEQKKYKSALKAYKILILKYPEKSSFFADRIKEIKHLKNNKS